MLSNKQSLGDRIKRYESAYQFTLTPRSCLFVRCDGRAFHSFTKKMKCVRPYDQHLMNTMTLATFDTAQEMQGFKGAYIQSDEATFMLTDFDSHETQGWFGYELNKIVSISAALMTANFIKRFWHPDSPPEKPPVFDSRAFIVPKDDAPNVFIWRQQDWNRNSVQMLAHAYFSHKELHEKNISDMHEMLHRRGMNWANATEQQKNGTFLFPGVLAPVFDKLSYEDLWTRLGLDAET